MLHEISEVFVSCKAEPRRRAVDHGVHRIRERPPPGRDGDDDENFDGFLGESDPEYRMQGLRNPGVFGACEERGERRARHAQQRNAGGAQEKRGPDLGGRTGAFAGGDHQPQYQQRGRHRGGSDDGRKGCKEIHRDGKYAIFRSLFETRRGAAASRGRAIRPNLGPAASAAQQPLQIFFSRAFTSASSAPIESTYFAPSAFETGAARNGGLAVADDAGRRGGLVVAGQPGAWVRYRFAFRRLRDRSLAERAKRDKSGKQSHFNPFSPLKIGRQASRLRDYSAKSRSFPSFCKQNARNRAPCPSVFSGLRHAAGGRPHQAAA